MEKGTELNSSLDAYYYTPIFLRVYYMLSMGLSVGDRTVRNMDDLSLYGTYILVGEIENTQIST